MVFNKKVVEEKAVVEEKKETIAKPKKVKVGKCEYCGADTKGGRFCPGHDSKLKSDLVKAYKTSQDPKAKEQLLERGWAKEEYFTAIDEKKAAQTKAKAEKEAAKAETKA